jgi:hypothetical protein
MQAKRLTACLLLVNLVCFVNEPDAYPEMKYENVGFGLVRMKNGVGLYGDNY